MNMTAREGAILMWPAMVLKQFKHVYPISSKDGRRRYRTVSEPPTPKMGGLEKPLIALPRKDAPPRRCTEPTVAEPSRTEKATTSAMPSTGQGAHPVAPFVTPAPPAKQNPPAHAPKRTRTVSISSNPKAKKPANSKNNAPKAPAKKN